MNDNSNDRRKLRLEDSGSFSHEECETDDLDEIIPFLKTEDPNIILIYLQKINSLIELNNDIDFFYDYIYQLIDQLNNIAELVDKVDKDDCNYKNFQMISNLSLDILDLLFSLETQIQENSDIKDPFFNYYIQSISDIEQMGTCFSVIGKMFYVNLKYKRFFFQSGYYDFIIQIPILQIQLEYLESLASIIAICIKQEDEIVLPLQLTTKLLNQLIILLENYQNYDSAILDLCAQGCYNYVSIGNTAISLFIVSDVHLKLIDAISNMSDIGAAYSISCLGKCFCSTPNAILSSDLLSILNNQEDEFKEIEDDFNIEMKLIEDVPFEIFKDGLELNDESARADVTLALCNVMVKVNLIVDDIFQSGLFESLLDHLKNDSFKIRLYILDVFVQIFKNITTSSLPLFIDDNFFEIVEELVESDIPHVEDIANEIYDLVIFDQQHEDIINEFCEFLRNRTL